MLRSGTEYTLIIYDLKKKEPIIFILGLFFTIFLFLLKFIYTFLELFCIKFRGNPHHILRMSRK